MTTSYLHGDLIVRNLGPDRLLRFGRKHRIEQPVSVCNTRPLQLRLALTQWSGDLALNWRVKPPQIKKKLFSINMTHTLFIFVRITLTLK